MAEQCARKSNENAERRSGPLGDDLEPIEVQREDVEISCEEDEEPLKSRSSQGTIEPKNPTNRKRKQK